VMELLELRYVECRALFYRHHGTKASVASREYVL